jgi:hypothetical protein
MAKSQFNKKIVMSIKKLLNIIIIFGIITLPAPGAPAENIDPDNDGSTNLFAATLHFNQEISFKL